MSAPGTSPPKVVPPLHSVTSQQSAPANVIIEVGPDGNKYYVQKAFLVHYSEYFSKALSGTWEEAKNGVVTLTDVLPGVFNLFVEWLYTQHLPSNYSQIADGTTSNEQKWMLRLYVFADRFAVAALRTAMNRAMVKKFNKPSPAPYQSVIYAFDNLPSTDPLLDLLVDTAFVTWYSSRDSTKSAAMIQDLPKDFFVRFYMRVGNERTQSRANQFGAFDIDFCSYHEHENEADKANCPNQYKLAAGKYKLERPDVNKEPKDTGSSS
ncbi:uncharacterized protein J4E92_001495 [Alternaria infectoria]|uniref:uncharacterized protein n=1 Tax=Alternaria infectoria TaxID=45303 RepID=UPI00221FF83E|nr:uncharacterized protein J4E92_001495 [Alternaria infectoria]KAI4936770.1 hypothetical protein J4E92_001495 [Alternaria infectoria]